ncbi:Phosphoethanolamine transferase EptA [compost metagenome]
MPMITWFSEGYQRALQLDGRCLQAKRDAALSQDNLFHSVLGLLKVNTLVYESSLDLFTSCRTPMPVG